MIKAIVHLLMHFFTSSRLFLRSAQRDVASLFLALSPVFPDCQLRKIMTSTQPPTMPPCGLKSNFFKLSKLSTATWVVGDWASNTDLAGDETPNDSAPKRKKDASLNFMITPLRSLVLGHSD